MKVRALACDYDGTLASEDRRFDLFEAVVAETGGVLYFPAALASTWVRSPLTYNREVLSV